MRAEKPEQTWSADRFADVTPPHGGNDLTVIVTVHEAYEHSLACLEALIANTTHPHRVLVVDDASSDLRLKSALSDFGSRHEHVRVHRNPQRLGYTASVNVGWRQVDGDVVLLNSDTVVTRGWLGRLVQAARSERKVATVTAVSNAAGAFSVPFADVENPLPHGFSVQDMAELVLQVSPRAIPYTPTGNGFCMWVSRVALEQMGGFDEQAFPDGYGEENDFCLRATAVGWVHLVDDRTYVYHRRGASYGERRSALMARNLETLAERHPGYAAEIGRWKVDHPLGLLRQRLSRALRRGRPNAAPGRDEYPILFVTHEGFGGVQNTTRDLVHEVSQSFPCVTLTTGLEEWTIRENPCTTGERETVIRFTTPWRIGFPLDAPRATALRELCARYGIRLAHVRHFLGNAPEMVDLFEAMDIPVVFSVHDFYTVCPTVKLLDEKGRFCGGRCTAGEGDCPGEDAYPERFPFLKHRYVHEWRRRTLRALRKCSSLVTTSRQVQEVLVETMPELAAKRWAVIEHGRDVRAFRDSARSPRPGRCVVLFFGQLTVPKGERVLRRLCELNQEHGEPFDFHFLGTPGELPFDELGATWHGHYRRDMLPERLASIRPSVTLMPAQWPETFSHVLTESWAAGVPVMASDTGALATRIRTHGGGWLVSDMSDAQAWFDELRRVLLSPGSDYVERRSWAQSYEPTTLATMAGQYLDLYRLALEPVPTGGSGGAASPAAVGAGVRPASRGTGTSDSGSIGTPAASPVTRRE